MESSSSFFAVALISLIAAISPGPDFFIVFRNSVVHSRKAGFLTAFGVSMAIVVHLTYTLIGIGLIITESPYLYAILKYSGVAYLFYIGLRGIISSFKKSSANVVDYTHETKSKQISPLTAFMQGFWTNLLNPKAAIFFISLFSQFIDTNTPYITGIGYGVITWSIALGWFLTLSYLLTHKLIVGRIDQFKIYVDRVMGGVLVALGFKMLFV